MLAKDSVIYGRVVETLSSRSQSHLVVTWCSVDLVACTSPLTVTVWRIIFTSGYDVYTGRTDLEYQREPAPTRGASCGAAASANQKGSSFITGQLVIGAALGNSGSLPQSAYAHLWPVSVTLYNRPFLIKSLARWPIM